MITLTPAAAETQVVPNGDPSLTGRGGTGSPDRLASTEPSPESADHDDQPLDSLGRFQILHPLGKGGMGSVFLAYDTLMNRKVALKIPRFGPKDREKVLERFRREARAAATFDHPNLCRIDKFDEFKGTHYLTMPYLEGRTLADCLESHAALPQRSVAALVRTLALAMADAHARQVVHRDLKPSNVMIVKGRGPVVVDFGLSLRVGYRDIVGAETVPASDVDLRVTNPGAVLGTVGYMSPEQVAGDLSTIGECSDVYSLGVILYELLTGRLPFTGPPLVVMGLIRVREPEPPSAHRLDLHPRLDAICRKAMAKEVKDRYASMLEFAGALGRYLRKEELTGLLDPVVTSEHLGKQSVQLLVTEFLDGAPQAHAPGPGLRIESLLNRLPGFVRDPLMAWASDGCRPSFERISGLLRPITGRFHAGHARIVALIIVVTLGGFFLFVKPGWLSGAARAILARFGPGDHPSKLAQGPDPPPAVNRDVARNPNENTVPARQWFRFERLPSIPWPDERVISVADGTRIRVQNQGSIPWPDARVISVVFTSDSKRLLVASNVAPYLQLYDLTRPGTPAIRSFNGHTSWVNQVALSSDDRRALSAGNDGTIRLWDMATGKEAGPPIKNLPSVPQRVAFSRDGTRAVASCDNILFVWNFREPGFRYKNDHSGTITSVSFSPDGRKILTTSTDYTARLWNEETLRQDIVIKDHTGPVTCGAFSADGRQFLTLSRDETLRLWETDTGRNIRTMKVEPAPTVGWGQPEPKDTGHPDWVAFSPDGHSALTTHHPEKTLTLWDLDAGRLVSRISTDRPLNKAVIAPDGRQVACGTFRGSVDRYELRPIGGVDPRQIAALNSGNYVQSVAFSPDGQRLLTGHDNNRTALLWSWRSGNLLQRLPGHGPRVLSVAFSPDGRLALTGDQDGFVRLWEPASGRLVRTLQRYNGWVFRVAFSVDGRLAYSTGGGDEWKDGPDTDTAIRVWDVEKGSELFKLEGHNGRVLGLSLSRDGQKVLTGGGTSLILWNARTGEAIRRFYGHTKQIFCVAFLPDGLRGISCSEDGTIRLWILESGIEIGQFKGHSRWAHWLAVSPGGDILATAHWSWPPENEWAELRLWEINSGKEISTLGWNPDAPVRGAFSPDGKYLAWGGASGTTRVYSIGSLNGNFFRLSPSATPATGGSPGVGKAVKVTPPAPG
jgi:WD40 repeat protein/serine/threonine protein kinase